MVENTVLASLSKVQENHSNKINSTHQPWNVISDSESYTSSQKTQPIVPEKKRRFNISSFDCAMTMLVGGEDIFPPRNCCMPGLQIPQRLGSVSLRELHGFGFGHVTSNMTRAPQICRAKYWLLPPEIRLEMIRIVAQ